MKTKEQIELDFRKDLKELLEVYGAELDLDYGEGFDQEGHMVVSINAKYDEEGEIKEEFCEFEI
jgi:hypothetical protein